ncbi:MAG: hypothetical protein ACYTEL_10855 [Planctomycetota bacterium]
MKLQPTRQPARKSLIEAIIRVFEDSRQFEEQQVGRFIREDGFLWIVDFGNGHVAVRPEVEVKCLAG